MSKEVFALFFSPTENTKNAVRALAKGIAKVVSENDFYSIDLTGPNDRRGVYEFGEDDIVLLGFPTYAGRIPNKVMPYVEQSIVGNKTLGISLVTYGNRAYDNSLKELSFLMEQNDFEIINAFAVPSEHAFTDKLAKGRPSQEDLDFLFNKGVEIGKKIAAGNIKLLKADSLPGDKFEDMKYYVPKKEDGTDAVFLKAMPVTDESKCSQCNECKYSCPMNCFKESVTIPQGICIKCQKCIKNCPNGAKHFDDAEFLSHVQYLINNYSENRCEIEVY